MSNLHIQAFEYCGPWEPEYYNQFFNPNICHVCKSGNRDNFILCDQCGLISYCTEQHRRLDFTEHMKLCAIIVQVLQVRPQQDTRKFKNWKQWIQSRKKLLQLIQEKFNRPMEPYMQQMILWSKSCVVCYQQAELCVCKRCFSANYCNEHAKIFAKKHNGAKCDWFMLLLNIDIKTISGNITDMSYSFLWSIDDKGDFEEMLEFCIEYLLASKEDIHWSAKDYVQSDYLSGPLTVYFACKEVFLSNILQEKNIIIHIIAANSVDVNGLPAWEILLHLVPDIQNLSIILIGPELRKRYKKYRLCESCRCKNNQLSFLSFSMTYHDFVSSKPRSLPNMIVGFHVEFCEGDMYPESIETIDTQNCPLILGFSCKQKAQNNINKLQKVLNMILTPDINKRNPFGGLAPHKDIETGDIYFRNEHLVTFEYLYDINATNNESNSVLSE